MADAISKPASLCRPARDVFSFYEQGIPDTEFFARLAHLERAKLQSLGLTLVRATPDDIPAIEALVRSRYDARTADEISAFDSYRYTLYGNVLTVRTSCGVIVACAYEVGYDHPDKPSYLLRLIVADHYESKGLATTLNRLSLCLAHGRGARTRHGLIHHLNVASLYVHLNRIGGYFSSLVQTPCAGIHAHFVSARPVNARTTAENIINDAALDHLLDAPTLPPQLRLVDNDQLDELTEALHHEHYVVIGLIRRSIQGQRAKLLLMRRP